MTGRGPRSGCHDTVTSGVLISLNPLKPFLRSTVGVSTLLSQTPRRPGQQNPEPGIEIPTSDGQPNVYILRCPISPGE